jgi:uncharacterized damage-inducible protein DinB
MLCGYALGRNPDTMATKRRRTKVKRKPAARAAVPAAGRAVRPGAGEAQLARMCVSKWRSRLEELCLPRLVECLGQLSDEEIWWRPNEASNSVGNLLLHLCGNMRQWIISGLGGAADVRERDKEFSERGPIDRRELREELQQTMRQAAAVLARLKPADLSRSYRIQQYDVTGYEAATQVTEHVAYHLGQIIYVTKMKRAKDLGFTRLPSASSKPSERKI